MKLRRRPGTKPSAPPVGWVTEMIGREDGFKFSPEDKELQDIVLNTAIIVKGPMSESLEAVRLLETLPQSRLIFIKRSPYRLWVKEEAPR